MRRDARAALTIAKNRPKIGLSAGRSSTAGFGGLDGGGRRQPRPVSLAEFRYQGKIQGDEETAPVNMKAIAKNPRFMRCFRRIRSRKITGNKFSETGKRTENNRERARTSASCAIPRSAVDDGYRNRFDRSYAERTAADFRRRARIA
jgi:hypothetical protein